MGDEAIKPNLEQMQTAITEMMSSQKDQDSKLLDAILAIAYLTDCVQSMTLSTIAEFEGDTQNQVEEFRSSVASLKIATGKVRDLLEGIVND